MKKPFSHLFPAILAAAALAGGVSTASAQASAAAAAPAAATAPASSGGNAAAGEKKAAMCIGCHGIEGYQASFPEVHRVPMIGGQTAAYITAALEGYQKGGSGGRRHPTMKAIAASLTKQDVADLAAFYEKQGPAPVASGSAAAGGGAAATVPGASAAASKLLQNCVTCHGVDFNSPNAGVPKLAGQHPDYLYVALKSYQTVDNANVGRADPAMSPQVKGVSHADLKAIAKYIGGLKGDLKVQPQSRFR